MSQEAMQVKEDIAVDIQRLLSCWQQEALVTEKTENLDNAIKIIIDASQNNKVIPIISPICANYETIKLDGKRRPQIHNDMVWSDRGLRRGYLLCHEEIPHRLKQLQQISGQPLNYLVVLVDYGMAETLFGPLNLDYDLLPQGTTIQQYIDEVLNENVAKVKYLINHGLNGNDKIQVTVSRLSKLAANTDFDNEWLAWNQKLRALLEVQNNQWAGLIRREVKKEGNYYRYAWGYTTDEQIQNRVIDQQYGLVATFGEWLHQLHNQVYSQNLQDKGSLIMLDTIPGPNNPAHSEFQAYNLPYPDGQKRALTPILRPFHNLVLLSDPAIEAPYLNKTLSQIKDEANLFNVSW